MLTATKFSTKNFLQMNPFNIGHVLSFDNNFMSLYLKVTTLSAVLLSINMFIFFETSIIFFIFLFP